MTNNFRINLAPTVSTFYSSAESRLWSVTDLEKNYRADADYLAEEMDIHNFSEFIDMSTDMGGDLWFSDVRVLPVKFRKITRKEYTALRSAAINH